MHTPSHSSWPRLLLLLLGVLAGLSFTPRSSAQTDAVTQSVWQLTYGVSNAQINQTGIYAPGQPNYPNGWLAGDDDGDGITNGAEMVAGTNPFKANSILKVSTVTTSGSNITVTFPQKNGKYYLLQATPSLNPTQWTFVTGVTFTGTANDAPGTATGTMTAAEASEKYFRVVVEDQSTAGDGVSDWAKLMMNYNTGSLFGTGGQTGYANATALAAALASQNIVTVTATDPSATQPASGGTASDTGIITFYRSGYQSFTSITVPFSVNGSAATGTSPVPPIAIPGTGNDYNITGTNVTFSPTTGLGSVTFPPGVNTVTLTVTPLGPTNFTRLNSAILSVTAQGGSVGSGYTLGTPASAGVTIYPASAGGVANGTGLTGQFWANSFGAYTDGATLGAPSTTATYSFTPTAGSTTSGTVVVTYLGTPAVPYAVGSTINLTFSSGVLNANSEWSTSVPSGQGNPPVNQYTVTAVGTPAANGTNTLTVQISSTGVALPLAGTGNVTLTPFATRTNAYNFGGIGTQSGTTFNTNPFYNPVTYNYTKSGTSGTVVISYVGTPSTAFSTTGIGGTINQPTLQFTSGNLFSATGTNGPGTYDGTYSITGTTANSSTVTISLANPAVVSWPSHGLSVGSPVVFTTTGALPSGLTAGNTYYVITAGFGTGSFEVSSTPGGSAVSTLSQSQSGTQTAQSNTLTVAVSGATLPASGTGNATLSPFFAPVTLAGGGTTRVDPTVDFVFGSGLPPNTTLQAGGNQNWGARWDSYLMVPTTGPYTFQIQAYDGARIYVNGALILNAWAPGSSSYAAVQSSPVTLTAGTPNFIRVEYYHLNNSTATVSLQWQPPGASSFTFIPDADAFISSTGTGTNGWAGLYWTNIGGPTTTPATSTVSISGASSPAVVAWTNHGLLPGTPIVFTGAPPAGITAGATYYVIATGITANSFEISTTQPGSTAGGGTTGSPVNITGSASGVTAMTYTDFVGLPRYGDYPGSLYNLSWSGTQPNATITSAATFSIRWDGYIVPTTTGSYSFNVSASDGARIYLDTIANDNTPANLTKIIDAWIPDSSAVTPAVSGTYTLTAGQAYWYRVEYNQTGNGTSPSAFINVAWELPGASSYTAIPLANLFRKDPLTGVVTSGTGLWASYYNGSTLTDPALYAVQDTNATPINGSSYNWGTGKPGGSNLGTSSNTNWSGTFTTNLTFPAAIGTYNFQLVEGTAGSLGQVFFGGVPMLPTFTSGTSTFSFTTTSASQVVPVTVQFYTTPTTPAGTSSTGQAILNWGSTPGGTTYTVVPAASLSGVQGTYYANTAFIGDPYFTDYPLDNSTPPKAQINYTKTSYPTDAWTGRTFSAAWDGYIAASTAGTYVFSLQAQPKARIIVNGTTVVDGWTTAGSATAAALTGSISLPGGTNARVPIHVDFASSAAGYTNTPAGAFLQVLWQPQGQSSLTVVPNSALFTDATTSQQGLVATYYPNITQTAPYFYQVVENNNPELNYINTATNGTTYTTGYGSGSPDPALPNTYYCARWSGQVLPQYTEPYYFTVKSDDGARLWVNGQLVIDHWVSQSVTEWTSAPISLNAGVFYDIVLEYLQQTSSAEVHLNWYSADQSEQVIPQSRLFPTMTGTVGAGPTGPTSTANDVYVAGSGTAYSYTIGGSNSNGAGVTYSASNLPSFLSLNGNVISSTGTVAPGNYQFTVTTTNAAGSSSQVVNLTVVSATGTITRELWTGLGGTNATDIPLLTTSPTSTDTTLTTLEDTAAYANNTGERLRGYFTAPATGNYYFWIAASGNASDANHHLAELWISNDNQAVTKVLRAYVAGTTGTAARAWNVQSSQQSPWLSLIAGQQYYFEVLHNTGGSGTSSNLSVGWFLDPTGNSVTSGAAVSSPVGISVASPTPVSVSIASPAVVTWNNHGLLAGTPVTFSTTGALPGGMSIAATYYVLSAGLTSNSFEISTSPVGSPVNTSGTQSGTQSAQVPSGVVTWAGHGLNAGTPVTFSTTGALPTGLTAGTTYYVLAPGWSANTFFVSATVGGSAVVTSGTQSGTQTAQSTRVYPIANGAGPAAPASGGIIPTYVLSYWNNPPSTTTPGTIYIANLAGPSTLSNIKGSGGAYVTVNGSTGIVHVNTSGLTSGITTQQIYAAGSPYPALPLFDLGAQQKNYPASLTSDGGYTWTISGAAATALGNGTAFVAIGTYNNPVTALNPYGELTGIFNKATGTQTAPSIPSYPSWTDDKSAITASRLLTQATYGPSPTDMTYVQANGCRAWIENQFTLAGTHTVPYVLANLSNSPQLLYGDGLFQNAWWNNSTTAADQLRQRVAFALSEILVISANSSAVTNNGRTEADYYDTLVDYAFDNYRNILKQVSLSSAMGIFLNMQGNQKGSYTSGLHPNENYAREIMQLFSIGLYRLWPDGTLVLDLNGEPIPTYNQSQITGMARALTGWTWSQTLPASGRLPTSFGPAADYLDPMVLVPNYHELGTKILLDNIMLPAAVVTSQTDTTHDPAPVSNQITIQSLDPVNGQGFTVNNVITSTYDLYGLREFERVLDSIMNNQSVAPYICRQLIQRLVTSNPQPAYVYRVVRAFLGQQNFDGVSTGIVGDMKDTIRAILMDPEARSVTAAGSTTGSGNYQFGKQREPLLRVTGPVRSFPVATISPAPASGFVTGYSGATYRELGGQIILLTTPTAHRLVNNDNVLLNSFADSGSSTTNLPYTQGYTVGNTAPSYSYAYNSTTNNNVATISAPGYQAGDSVNVGFTSGALANFYNTPQSYTVQSATSPVGTSGSFTVNLPIPFTMSSVATGNPCKITTSAAHQLVTGTSVTISGVTGGTFSPSINGTFAITVTSPTQFTVPVNCTSISGLSLASALYTFTASGNAVTPNNFTVSNNYFASQSYSYVNGSPIVTISASGYTAGHQLYIEFASGPLLGAGYDGVYTITSANTTSGPFTVTLSSTPPSSATPSGSALIPKLAGGYTVTTVGSNSTITLQIGTNFDLNIGDQVWVDILVPTLPLSPPSGVYTVAAIPGGNLITVNSISGVLTGGTQASAGQVTYPLNNNEANRHGTCNVGLGTYNIGNTTTNSTLEQTPLYANTVFNFFYPNYAYPGAIAAAGMTTPEFQLTDATDTANLTNTISQGILAAGNTYGFTSFFNGNDSLVLDLGSYMDIANPGTATSVSTHTQDSAIPSTVSTFGTLLTGGNLSSGTQTAISNYVLSSLSGTIGGVATGSPCTITTSGAHGLSTNAVVTISGVTGGSFSAVGTGSASINSAWTITVTGTNTFTIPINCTSNTGISLTSAVYTVPSFFPAISSIGTGNPCTVNTSQPHNLATGASVTISKVTGGTFTPTINGTFTVTVTSPTQFTVPVNYSSSTGINAASAIYDSSTLPNTTMRDRLRAILHLIFTTAEYAIQK